jgi:hypothetical protein
VPSPWLTSIAGLAAFLEYHSNSAADAVQVEQLLAINPAARSKRPEALQAEPTQVWAAEQPDIFLTAARSHRLFAFYRLAAYTGRAAANCSTSGGMP